ncbi:Uncharacterized conserved protein YafD, endonuclease/exonuclease/phosphatase (EEP) superfamily [Cohaesibacter sp. ES.047]|uniref:endonuclease/exonuclease/phosphatase family protein n=1 Tax=Cohaesibacter sp. ES.047 TaxID=1798205 RepID=UPI000BBFF5F5|nr:endonuclease/exonuclease/phosphatase family protein [Cohaesibacter sp. ES.047]SNY92874.1 Uncharacterized conserved protein YafD, endonuclease/exonuclease/phosphatase (EEP) superfamily [Cohaesibacter sp. ES.047]
MDTLFALTVFLTGLSALCLVMSLVPLVPEPHGMIRSFDFVRLQVFTLSAMMLIASLVLLWLGDRVAHDLIVLSATMAGVAMLIQFAHILTFTPLWPKQTARFTGNLDDVDTISLLVCNVKQSNRDFDKVASLIKTKKPDIAIFMETDEAWANALKPHLSGFADVLSYPQSNSYGLMFASRFTLGEQQIQFLLNDEVPSVSCTMTLPRGRSVRFVALHPEPPVPVRDTMGRDAEILLIGEKARNEKMPMIVTGDLNDVAWSRTTRRFLRLSRLMDPRQGRGVFNSFDARHWFLRWPLDHVFHSPHFELVTIERQPFVGSDHFPMYFCFALTGDNENDLPPKAEEDDFNEADGIVESEKSRSRKPVGVDWE